MSTTTTAQTPSRTTGTGSPAGRTGKRILAWIATSVAIVITALVASVAPASAATVGGVTVVASASFSSCAQTVEILPMTGEPVGSNYSVYAKASVWEVGRGWVTTAWYRVDGITTLMFYGVNRHPYAYAYMTYARYVNGAWRYANEYQAITDDLDNGFCPVS